MNKTKLFLISALLVLTSTMQIMAQVFCTASSSAGTLSGYTTSFQMTPIVTSGSAWHWTTTLTAGLTYSYSNCTSHGGISEDTIAIMNP